MDDKAIQDIAASLRNPGGHPAIEDALVIGMRISWTLSN